MKQNNNTYTGISYQKSYKKYSCRYTLNSVRYHLGFYSSKEEAYCVREAFEYSILMGEILTENLKSYKKKPTKQQLIDSIIIELQILHSRLKDDHIKVEIDRIIKLME